MSHLVKKINNLLAIKKPIETFNRLLILSQNKEILIVKKLCG